MLLATIAPFRDCSVVTEQDDRKSKRQIGPRLDDALTKEVRILAIRQERRFNELIEEALHDLLKKYQAKKGLLPKGK